MSSITDWAENLVREVEQVWRQHPFLTAGYSVFYSPVQMNPKLMVIGFNPGGGTDSFDPKQALKIPEKHEYFSEDYPLARRMRSTFESIEKLDLLENSVKTNLIFFRTRNVEEWETVEPVIRKQLERFSMGKVVEIISTLKPKTLIAEGIETYTYLKRLLSLGDKEESMQSQGRSLFIANDNMSPRLLGIIHPTGARVNNSEWDKIRDALKTHLLRSDKVS